MYSCKLRLTICKELTSNFKNSFYETNIHIHSACIKHIPESTKYSGQVKGQKVEKALSDYLPEFEI